MTKFVKQVQFPTVKCSQLSQLVYNVRINIILPIVVLVQSLMILRTVNCMMGSMRMLNTLVSNAQITLLTLRLRNLVRMWISFLIVKSIKEILLQLLVTSVIQDSIRSVKLLVMHLMIVIVPKEQGSTNVLIVMLNLL